ncbi:MAG: glutamyl-tRNA reductase [bacterium]
MKLQATGLNHKTAPVDVREKLAFDREEIHPVLRQLDRAELIKEAVLLSTCNRTELYFLPGNKLQNPIDAVEVLCEFKDVPVEEIDPYLYEHDDLRAVEHCFEVAGSLNSMVIGETEILGQVKTAYDIAREGGFCGKFLHQLFQESFRIAKRIRNETHIHRLPTSVGSCAVALASQIFGDLSGHSALVVGGGDMSKQCLDHLTDEGISSVKVANRTLDKAEELAEKYDGSAHPLDDLEDLFDETDVLISSTGSEEPIIHRSHLEKAFAERGTKPIFIIDIAVPRDVDEDVRTHDNVYLYDIDSLEELGQQNLEYRKQAMDQAMEIVQEGVQQYEEWIKTQDMGPLIKELKQDVYQLVEKELREHFDKQQTSLNKSDLQLVAHRITNKLLDDPVNVIKEKAIEEETDSLSTVREMFDLESGLG